MVEEVLNHDVRNEVEKDLNSVAALPTLSD